MKTLLKITIIITGILSTNIYANNLFVKSGTIENNPGKRNSETTDIYTTKNSEKTGNNPFIKIKDVFVPTELGSKLKEIRNNRPIMFSKVDGKPIFPSTKINEYYKIENNEPKLVSTSSGRIIQIEGSQYIRFFEELVLQ
jgi:hypothetical protein